MNRKPSDLKIKTTHIPLCDIGNGATVCRNLRRVNIDNKSFMPLLPPETIAKGNFTPIHSACFADGENWVLLLSGLTVHCMCLGNSGSVIDSPTKIATLKTKPMSAVTSGKSVLIMTDDGAYRIDYDVDRRKWVDRGLMPQFPGLSIMATNETSFTSSTGKLLLEGDYSHWQGALNKTDMGNFSAALLDAYKQIKQDASVAGCFIQPVLARYHLLDENENVLYSSSPVIVSLSSGFQCVNMLTLSTPDFKSIDSFNLEANGFKIGLEVSDFNESPWVEIVKNVIVEVSPVIDPIENKALVSCRLVNATTTGGKIETFMPGIATAMNATGLHLRQKIESTYSVFSDISYELCRLSNPYLNGVSISALSPRMYHYLGVKPNYSRFSSQVACSCGDSILWGNVSLLRYFAPTIEDIAAVYNKSSGYWRAFVAVKFSSGDECVVWSGEGENCCPEKLAPAFGYPDADATEMTIAISCDGVVRRQTFKLSPIPGCDFSVYINSTFAPFALAESALPFIIPSQYSGSRYISGSVAVSSSISPMSIAVIDKVVDGDVIAITPAVKSMSSWDFARTHAYLFTSAGVYAASVNASRTTISAHVIDNRGVKGHRAVAFANDAVYAVLAGDLVSVAGARTSTVLCDAPVSEIAWDNHLHAICGLSQGEPMMRVYDVKNKSMVTVDAPDGSMLYGLYGTLIISNGERLLSMAQSKASTVPIKWKQTIDNSGVMRQSVAVSFFIAASHFSGTIKLRAHGGAGDENSYPVTTLDINGAINSPIVTKIILPPHPYLTIEIDADVSTDMKLHRIQISY